MESLLPEYDAFGAVRERAGSALPGIAPTNAYRCNDGHYVLVAGNGDSIFRRLMRAIGRADLENDPELVHNDGRVRRVARDRRRHRGMDAAAQPRRSAGRARRGRRAGRAHLHGGRHRERPAVPGARDDRRGARPPTARTLKVPGVVPKLSATPGRIAHPAPRLGEHTRRSAAAPAGPRAALESKEPRMKTGNGTRLLINEVATRDGFQMESRFIPTDDKVALIDRLSALGYAKIEVTSFTSAKAIPALRDGEEVMHRIARAPRRGLHRAGAERARRRACAGKPHRRVQHRHVGERDATTWPTCA